MDKKSASLILQSTLAFSQPIGEVIKHIHTVADEVEKKAMLKAIGDVMGILTKDIVFPIVKQYPELDPDK